MKRLVSFLLCVLLIAFALSACGSQEQRLRADAAKIARITATDALYSSYLYVIEDKAAISELCAMVNELTFRELNDGEEAPDDLWVSGKLYSLQFYDEDNERAVLSCEISPQGYLFTEDMNHPYVLIKKPDEARLKSLLETYNTFQ